MQTLTDDNGWLDLAHGEEAIVKGRLNHVSPEGLTIVFADWSELFIDSDHAIQLQSLIGETIELRVVRTEDGLEAYWSAIEQALNQGGN